MAGKVAIKDKSKNGIFNNTPFCAFCGYIITSGPVYTFSCRVHSLCLVCHKLGAGSVNGMENYCKLCGIGNGIIPKSNKLTTKKGLNKFKPNFKRIYNFLNHLCCTGPSAKTMTLGFSDLTIPNVESSPQQVLYRSTSWQWADMAGGQIVVPSKSTKDEESEIGETTTRPVKRIRRRSVYDNVPDDQENEEVDENSNESDKTFGHCPNDRLLEVQYSNSNLVNLKTTTCASFNVSSCQTSDVFQNKSEIHINSESVQHNYSANISSVFDNFQKANSIVTPNVPRDGRSRIRLGLSSLMPRFDKNPIIFQCGDLEENVEPCNMPAKFPCDLQTPTEQPPKRCPTSTQKCGRTDLNEPGRCCWMTSDDVTLAIGGLNSPTITLVRDDAVMCTFHLPEGRAIMNGCCLSDTRNVLLVSDNSMTPTICSVNLDTNCRQNQCKYPIRSKTLKQALRNMFRATDDSFGVVCHSPNVVKIFNFFLEEIREIKLEINGVDLTGSAYMTNKGHFFISSYMNHLVFEFDNNGRFLQTFGLVGASGSDNPGWLWQPTAVTSYTENDVIVGNQEGNVHIVEEGHWRLLVRSRRSISSFSIANEKLHLLCGSTVHSYNLL